jgi:hypothetical protein
VVDHGGEGGRAECSSAVGPAYDAHRVGGEVRAVPANDVPAQRAFVHQVFGVAA